MKRILALNLFFLVTFVNQKAKSQTVFCYESFGLANPSNQGNLAQSFAPTFTNGACGTTALAAGAGNWRPGQRVVHLRH